MRLVPVSREHHSGKRLRQLSSFAFAAGMTAAEVVIGEAGPVAACYPMFFVERGESVRLIALFGLAEGKNLFIDADGRWTGQYLPVLLRCHPFTTANDESGKPAVLVDEDAGLLSDDEGEALFDAERGEPAGPLARAIMLLSQMNADGVRTAALAKQMKDAGILVPAMNADGQQGRPRLLAVDEKTLNELPDETFLALKNSGALGLAYAQMFSLGQMAALQTKAQPARAAS